MTGNKHEGCTWLLAGVALLGGVVLTQLLCLQRVDAAAPIDSPGLDDFAHMGLITDLLE